MLITIGAQRVEMEGSLARSFVVNFYRRVICTYAQR